jgi:hypothetical protein
MKISTEITLHHVVSPRDNDRMYVKLKVASSYNDKLYGSTVQEKTIVIVESQLWIERSRHDCSSQQLKSSS